MTDQQITVEQLIEVARTMSSTETLRRKLEKFAAQQRADATRELQRENAELKQAKLGTDLLNAELVGDLASAKWRLAEAELNIKTTITSMIDGLIKTVSIDIDDDDQSRSAAWALGMLKSQIAEINSSAAHSAQDGETQR